MRNTKSLLADWRKPPDAYETGRLAPFRYERSRLCSFPVRGVARRKAGQFNIDNLRKLRSQFEFGAGAPLAAAILTLKIEGRTNSLILDLKLNLPEPTHSNFRTLGKSELQVSPVALGCWPIAGMTSLDVNDDDSRATIGAALESGINFLDTAYCYGANGESERLIGQAIAPLIRDGRRDEIVIASKGGIHWDQDVNKINDASPSRIIRECEESLQRMNVDVIDLHYLHSPDPKIPVAETAGAFAKLIESGKIRAAAASNFDVPQLEQFHAACPIAAVQPPYNMLQRSIESDIIPWCLENDVSVINYWPLMKGLLAGKIRRGHQFDPADKRLSYDVFRGEKFEQAQTLLDELDLIAAEAEKSVAQVVINWTMNQPGITSTLCGAKRDWQIRETAGAMGWNLSPNHLDRIDRLLSM